MYNEIYNAIEKYNNIVLARHIGVDPDAMCSAIALRDSIKKTFPNKELMKFFNRLSDYLFVSARYENYLQGIKDVISV